MTQESLGNKKAHIAGKVKQNWQSAIMLAGMVVPLATGISPVFAADTTTAPVKVSTTGTKINVDDTALQKAISDAKQAGVEVAPATNGTQSTDYAGMSTATSAISSDYTSQANHVLATLKQQEALNDTYASEMQTYNLQKAQYDKDEAQYKTAQAAYDQSIAEQKANATKPGYATSTIVQALQLKAEGHAQVSINSNDHLLWGNNGQQQTTPTINPVSDYRTNPNSGKNADGDQVEFYETALSKGQSVAVTYDKLANSSYNNRPITKLVRTISYGTNGNDDPIGMAIANDPTVGFWYLGGSAASGSFERSVNVVDQYYYADGSQVALNAKDAYISAGSLNNYYGGTANEHIERVKVPNSTFLPINGSSVTDNGGWYNALQDNSTGANGGLLASDWDKNTAPN